MSVKFIFRPSSESYRGAFLDQIREKQVRLSDLNCNQKMREIARRCFNALKLLFYTVADLSWWLLLTITVYPAWRLGKDHLINLISIVVSPFFAVAAAFGFYAKAYHHRKFNGMFIHMDIPKARDVHVWAEERRALGLPLELEISLERRGGPDSNFCNMGTKWGTQNYLCLAEYEDFLSVKKLLMAGDDSNAQDAYGNTFWHYLLTMSYQWGFPMFRESPNLILRVLDFCYAARNDQRFPKFKIDLDVRNHSQVTPLEYFLSGFFPSTWNDLAKFDGRWRPVFPKAIMHSFPLAERFQNDDTTCAQIAKKLIGQGAEFDLDFQTYLECIDTAIDTLKFKWEGRPLNMEIPYGALSAEQVVTFKGVVAGFKVLHANPYVRLLGCVIEADHRHLGTYLPHLRQYVLNLIERKPCFEALVDEGRANAARERRKWIGDIANEIRPALGQHLLPPLVNEVASFL